MCFWFRSTIEYSAVQLIGRVYTAGTDGQRYGCGRLLPDLNHMGDRVGDILMESRPKENTESNTTRPTLLYLFLPAVGQFDLPRCRITKERTMIVTPVTKLLRIRVYVYHLLLLHGKFPNS